MNFTVGDTAPPLAGSCKQITGGDVCAPTTPAVETPANLAGAAVELHIDCGGVTILTKTPSTVSATDGGWSYDWIAGDLTHAGVYSVEAQVTYSDGRIQTFGPATFRVQPQIA